MEIQDGAVSRGKHFRIGLGTTVQIQFSGVQGGIMAQMVGMKPDNYLIVHITPETAGLVKTEDKAIVRYVYSGTVYGFSSSVLSIISTPAPIVFLEYPEAFEFINLRKMDRLDCLLPCTARIGEVDYKGVILDISPGGCRVSIDLLNEIELPRGQIGEEVALRFEMVGITGVQNILAVVRNIRQDSKKYEFGMQFHSSDLDLKDGIERYVRSILSATADTGNTSG